MNTNNYLKQQNLFLSTESYVIRMISAIIFKELFLYTRKI